MMLHKYNNLLHLFILLIRSSTCTTSTSLTNYKHKTNNATHFNHKVSPRREAKLGIITNTEQSKETLEKKQCMTTQCPRRGILLLADLQHPQSLFSGQPLPWSPEPAKRNWDDNCSQTCDPLGHSFLASRDTLGLQMQWPREGIIASTEPQSMPNHNQKKE